MKPSSGPASAKPHERKGPAASANDFPLGAVHRGLDGHMYHTVAAASKNGVPYQRWVKVPAPASKPAAAVAPVAKAPKKASPRRASPAAASSSPKRKSTAKSAVAKPAAAKRVAKRSSPAAAKTPKPKYVRKAPAESASSVPAGTERVGQDGHLYVTAPVTSRVKQMTYFRWVKLR